MTKMNMKIKKVFIVPEYHLMWIILIMKKFIHNDGSQLVEHREIHDIYEYGHIIAMVQEEIAILGPKRKISPLSRQTLQTF